MIRKQLRHATDIALVDQARTAGAEALRVLADLLSPTNSIVQQDAGAHPYTTSPTNSTADPVAFSYDTALAFVPWRTNPNFVGAILVAADIPPMVMGDYHIFTTSSPAYNLGASDKAVPSYQQQPPPPLTPLAAPTTDIDGQGRPALGGFDSGADEITMIAVAADLSITKTDGVAGVTAGGPVAYTIVVSNSGPDPATGAAVVDNLPAALTGATWTCLATAGSSCGSPSGSGNVDTTVNLLSGGSTTFTVTATVAADATGTLANTATVAAPAGTTDSVPGNNSATDTDTISPPSADLSITKTDGVTSIAAGGNVTYTISVDNAGPSPVTAAPVTDTFPAALTVDSWTCLATAGSSCTATGTLNDRTGTVTLLSGGSATYTAIAAVAADATGTVANTATVAAPAGTTDPDTNNNSATDTDDIYVPTPDLSITKTDGVTSVIAGGPVTYDVIVTNPGPSAVTAAPVTDTFPASLTVSSWTCAATAGSSCEATGTGNNRTGTVTLLSGGSATFTGTATVAANATGTLANTATVAAPAGTTDPNPSNNSATDTDTIGNPTISGTVTAAGTGVAGAIVYVFDAGTAAYVGNAITDAGGAYSVALPPGTYKLWIQTNTAGYPDQAYGPDGTFENATAHRPHHRQPDRGRRAGRGGLDPHHLGTVTAAGTGVAGAIVYVFDAASSAYVGNAFTDAGGAYSLALPVGHLQPVGPDQHGGLPRPGLRPRRHLRERHRHRPHARPARPRTSCWSRRRAAHHLGHRHRRAAPGSRAPSCTCSTRAPTAYVGNTTTGAGGAYSVSLPSGTYKLWIQTNTAGYPDQAYGPDGTLRERHRARPHHRPARPRTSCWSRRPRPAPSAAPSPRRAPGSRAPSCTCSTRATSAYVGNAFTDAGGAYTLALPSGTYKLWVQTNTAGYPDQAYGPDGTFENATAIDLTRGQPDRGRRAGGGTMNRLLRTNRPIVAEGDRMP